MRRVAPEMVPIALGLALSGCAVGPDYRPASAIALGIPDKFDDADPRVGEDLSRWWDRFGDPALSTLVARGLAANLDIAQAAARLVQAREDAVQAGALRAPTLAGSGSVGRNLNPGFPDTSNFSARIDAQWNADLFGGISRNAEASRASLAAAGFGLADVRTAIAAEIARNAIDARALSARLEIARDTLRTQDDNLEIAGFRVQAGLVSALDVEQARAQRAATAAAIPALVRAEAGARNRLSVLTGGAPGSVDTTLGTSTLIPPADVDPALGIPADTLRQRPDVRRAERLLAAATARVGVAQAQLYPALTLSGSLGTNATALRTLTDFVSGNVFASLAQTIFDGGRLRSAVRQRRAAVDESFAAYKSTVLSALEDIANARIARETADARARALDEQVAAANAAAVLSRISYRAGLTDFRTLLDAERTLLSARDGLAAAQGDRATALVQLYLALGGGWSPDVPPA